ncbi:hypothetical protein, partial [Chamaesiphon sp. VAR_69_metabat_338]|uniref:hypothetical protein n=1 Tax=Chamaesiphon sp. VAR_69_metabat_338 TaxID=2964704 RepID=UPI00286D73C9
LLSAVALGLSIVRLVSVSIDSQKLDRVSYLEIKICRGGCLVQRTLRKPQRVGEASRNELCIRFMPSIMVETITIVRTRPHPLLTFRWCILWYEIRAEFQRQSSFSFALVPKYSGCWWGWAGSYDS